MKPPQNEQHPDVRRLVLDAAIAIITSTGAESLSMREVARQAGVSHQAPYHYFKDRSGIFAAISEEGFQRLAQAFREVSNTANSTGESAAKLGFQAYVRFAMRDCNARTRARPRRRAPRLHHAEVQHQRGLKLRLRQGGHGTHVLLAAQQKGLRKG
jgi:AcrR family transcriptional regulator